MTKASARVNSPPNRSPSSFSASLVASASICTSFCRASLASLSLDSIEFTARSFASLRSSGAHTTVTVAFIAGVPESSPVLGADRPCGREISSCSALATGRDLSCRSTEWGERSGGGGTDRAAGGDPAFLLLKPRTAGVSRRFLSRGTFLMNWARKIRRRAPLARFPSPVVAMAFWSTHVCTARLVAPRMAAASPIPIVAELIRASFLIYSISKDH